MLRYDNHHLILPDAYLETPAFFASALQLLNPYQISQIEAILACDLLLAVEGGNAEYALRQISNEGGSGRAVWCCAAYEQHLRALTTLRSYGLGNPYEEQEYRDLMAGWEGTRRRAWVRVERGREQWVAMLREY